MIHILDGQKNEILDYVTQDDIIDDTHRKSLKDTLETYNFITFADRRFSEYLEKRNRIIIPDEDDSLVEFVIFEAAKYKDTEGHKAQVFAHASYLELKKASILYPDNGFTGTASQHGGRALNDTGWQVGVVEGKGTKKLTINEHTNPYEFLKRIAKEFEVELKFRVEHDGNKIIGRYVDLLERVGMWRGREVEFGKDLDGIRRVEKQDIVTALLGLGPEREDGTRLEFLVEDFDALKRWGRIDEHGNLKHLIEPYEPQSERSEMTQTQLIQYTRTALNKRINTQVTFETTIIDLENVTGMENKKIRFGDTIRIKDTTFNPPLYLEARVFEQDRSIKSKAKKDIKLGDFIEFTEEEVNAIWKQLQKQIQNRVSHYEMVEYTYDKLTIDDKDETVFEEGKTFAEATGITAENNAKEYAVEQDELIKVDVKEYADTVSEQQAQSALDQAKQYAVAKTVYDNQMQSIADDMADKADLDYIDGKLVSKANKDDTYTIDDVDNMINNTVSKTQYTTDMDGVVTDLESQGTRLGQNEIAIGLKADSTDLDAVENSLNNKIGNVEVKADAVEISVSEVKADLDGLEIGGRNLTGNFNLKPWASSNGVIHASGVGLAYAIKLDNDTNYALSRKTIEYNNRFRLAFFTNGFQDADEIIDKVFNKQVNHDNDLIVKFNSENYNWLVIYVTNQKSLDDIEKTKIQLEKGNKATDWTPAPEDTDDAINQVSGRVETLDGEIVALAGEVSLKASQSIVDSLEGRVSTAEGELSVLPGQISAKVSKDGAFGELNLSPDRALLDFERVNITGQLEAKHIKSLAGLNVNDQFVVDASGRVTIGNDRVSIDDKGIQITRPDGAVWMQNGLINNEYNISGYDPYLMDYGDSDAGVAVTKFKAFNDTMYDSWYTQVVGRLDGRGASNDVLKYDDIRDQSLGYTIRFQRYEFVHSARYLKITYQIANNSRVNEHRFRLEEITSVPSSSKPIQTQITYADGDRGTKNIIIDLGRPSYAVRAFDIRLGWQRSKMTKDSLIRFRIPRMSQTDIM